MAHILIIEDDDQVAQVIADIVSECGHTSDRSVGAYGAALRMLHGKGQYDIVLMDLLLQGANGAVAALAMRGLGYEGPILVVTGGLIPIDQGLFDAAGFAGKILKPFSLQDLRNEIDRHLAARKEH